MKTVIGLFTLNFYEVIVDLAYAHQLSPHLLNSIRTQRMVQESSQWRRCFHQLHFHSVYKVFSNDIK